MPSEIPTQATNMNPQAAAALRQAFRYFNRLMLLMWRLDMARWFTIAPRYTGQIMVLNHVGHKSKLPRRTPLNYALIDGELYCTAGFGQVAHWYRNVMVKPEVEVWLPDNRWVGVVEDVTERADALPLLRQVLVCSGFAAFAAGINPYTMTDAALTEATRGYRLVHIRRTAPATSPDAPSDLRWVWQVATFALLALLLVRPKRHPR